MRLICLLLVLLSPASALNAQEPDSAGPGRATGFTSVGSRQDDRARTDQLLGGTPVARDLIRSTSSISDTLTGRRDFAVILPRVALAWNSALPFTLNDGALWAGRGLNARMLMGMRVRAGPVHVTLAPQILYMENRDFQILPSGSDGRDEFASPWWAGIHSADLPLRFGNQQLTVLDPGQSSVSITAGPVVVGASTEDQWWGPGIRNALVMGNNAPGIPHLFIRNSTPLSTRFGDFTGKMMSGGLTESLYFDSITANDQRSVSALAITFTPSGEPDLSIGMARAVYAAADGLGGIASDGLNAILSWPRRPEVDETEEPIAAEQTEQILSLFTRWVFPEAGFEVYGELARLELPRSFKDVLETPEHTQAYTLGLQWARRVADGPNLVRLQTEISYLEQTATNPERPVRSYYTSPSVSQGYTQRGQSIGASIGPGASSQWAAMDYMDAGWEIGIFGGRVRWANDAYYRQPTGFSFWSHDVSVFGGVRGGAHTPWGEATLEMAIEKRFSYLFQNYGGGFGPDRGDDHRNLTLRASIAAGRPARP
jgi:hypothetical protein